MHQRVGNCGQGGLKGKRGEISRCNLHFSQHVTHCRTSNPYYWAAAASPDPTLRVIAIRLLTYGHSLWSSIAQARLYSAPCAGYD
jgi:hypothetical protein